MKRFVKLPVTILKEGSLFVAYTPALDLSTSGKSFEEVKKRFGEAVNIFFEELERMGTVDEVLHDLGWEKAKRGWVPLATVAHEIHNTQVAV